MNFDFLYVEVLDGNVNNVVSIFKNEEKSLSKVFQWGLPYVKNNNILLRLIYEYFYSKIKLIDIYILVQ